MKPISMPPININDVEYVVTMFDIKDHPEGVTVDYTVSPETDDKEIGLDIQNYIQQFVERAVEAEIESLSREGENENE